MSEMAQEMQKEIEAMRKRSGHGKPKSAGASEPKAKVRAEPKVKAKAEAAVAEPSEPKPRNPLAGIKAKTTMKNIFINTEAALAVTQRGVSALITGGSLSGDELFAAQRLIARLKARGVK